VIALLRRELRRLAPYALAGAALCALGPALVSQGWRGLVVALPVGLVALPALLAVAAVAPDTSGGGVAFLSRLPVPARRVFAAKLLAAVGWAVVCLLGLGGISLTTAAAMDATEADPSEVLAALAGVGLFGLGIGLVASVTAHRTLPALLLAPCLACFLALVVLGVPFVALGVPASPFVFAVAPLLGLASLGLAAAAFVRGERFRRSLRPAAIALGGLGACVVVTLGGTTAAHAWTVEAVAGELAAAPEWGVASPSGERVAVSLEGHFWTGSERRVAVLDRTTGAAWLAPVRGAAHPAFSPDGRRLLLRATAKPGGWLVDLETGSARRLERGFAKEGFGFPHVLWRTSAPEPGAAWRRGEPLLLRVVGGARLEAYSPLAHARVDDDDLVVAEPRWEDVPRLFYRRGYPLPEGTRLAGLLGERVVLADAEGLRAVAAPALVPRMPVRYAAKYDPDDRLPEGERLLRWAEGERYDEAVVSPTGRYALARTAGSPPRLHLYDLEDGSRRVPASDPELGLRLQPNTVEFAPGEEAVAVARPRGGVAFYGLPTGDLLLEAAPDDVGQPVENVRGPGGGVVYERPDGSWLIPIQPSAAGPVAWSPDGRRAALPWGPVVDPTDGRRVRPSLGAVALLDSKRAVYQHVPLDAQPGELPGGGE